MWNYYQLTFVNDLATIGSDTITFNAMISSYRWLIKKRRELTHKDSQVMLVFQDPEGFALTYEYLNTKLVDLSTQEAIVFPGAQDTTSASSYLPLEYSAGAVGSKPRTFPLRRLLVGTPTPPPEVKLPSPGKIGFLEDGIRYFPDNSERRFILPYAEGTKKPDALDDLSILVWGNMYEMLNTGPELIPDVEYIDLHFVDKADTRVAFRLISEDRRNVHDRISTFETGKSNTTAALSQYAPFTDTDTGPGRPGSAALLASWGDRIPNSINNVMVRGLSEGAYIQTTVRFRRAIIVFQDMASPDIWYIRGKDARSYRTYGSYVDLLVLSVFRAGSSGPIVGEVHLILTHKDVTEVAKFRELIEFYVRHGGEVGDMTSADIDAELRDDS